MQKPWQTEKVCFFCAEIYAIIFIYGGFSYEQFIVGHQHNSESAQIYPEEGSAFGACGFFSIFSDATRMKIISALTITEMCVTDISEILGINQTTVSHQLKIMRQAGVVGFRREGKILFYFVTSPIVENVMLNGVVYLGY